MVRAKRSASGNRQNGELVEASVSLAEENDLSEQVNQPDGKGLSVPSQVESDAQRSQEISIDPESDEDVPVDPEEFKEALSRPPPVNSDYLPLPWKGRLGYVRSNV